MPNIFGLFGVVGKWFTGAILVTGLFFLLRWLWFSPEILNSTARGYLKHVDSLQADSTLKHLLIIDLRKTNKKLVDEAKKAQDFGNQWKDRFKSAVAESDANTDLLSDKDQQLAYYKALLKALPAASVPSAKDIQGASPIIVKAGLKTANKLNLATTALDTMNRTVGYLQAANERLGKGLSTVSSGLTALSKQAEANQKGGIPIIRYRRVKQNKATKKTADSLNAIIKETTDLGVSDLELNLNKKP